jgi:hypothetical protein
MAEITLTAAFSTVPAPDQEAIKRVLNDTIEQLAQEDKNFTLAKIVFTESNERWVTAELDGVKNFGVTRVIGAAGMSDLGGRRAWLSPASISGG